VRFSLRLLKDRSSSHGVGSSAACRIIGTQTDRRQRPHRHIEAPRFPGNTINEARRLRRFAGFDFALPDSVVSSIAFVSLRDEMGCRSFRMITRFSASLQTIRSTGNITENQTQQITTTTNPEAQNQDTTKSDRDQSDSTRDQRQRRHGRADALTENLIPCNQPRLCRNPRRTRSLKLPESAPPRSMNRNGETLLPKEPARRSQTCETDPHGGGDASR